MTRQFPYASQTVVLAGIAAAMHVAKLPPAMPVLQQALGLGLIGFFIGKLSATLWAPAFPKYVLLLQSDALRGLAVVMVICGLASILAIRVALRVDPAQAIS